MSKDKKSAKKKDSPDTERKEYKNYKDTKDVKDKKTSKKRTITEAEIDISAGAPLAKKKLSTNTDENYTLDLSSDSGFNHKLEIEKFDKLSKQVKKALSNASFTHVFPVQIHTFEHILLGKDVIVKARTGSGKTLGFVLPVIEKFYKSDLPLANGRTPRALILTPTRELAIQINRVIEQLSSGFTTCLLYGGTRYDSQENLLRRGVDIVVGTPGRIIDHIERRNLILDKLDFMILDEADEMLNFGFADAIESILAGVPKSSKIQTLLFSATIPDWVSETAKKYFQNRSVTIDFVGNDPLQTATSVEHLAISCSYSVRNQTLSDVVKVYAGLDGRTLVFANTKAEANEIALNSSISNDCQVLHGDIHQTQREVTMNSFREGKFHVLVATDVAARGIDIDGIALVIQTEPPKDHETYVHRAGRTGRAGRSGICVTFFSQRDSYAMKNIETNTGIKFQRIGTPQLDQLVDVGAQEAIKKIDAVNGQMIPLFIDQAKQLIEATSAEDALAAALAVISGYSQPQQQRSLLSSMVGFTTIHILSDEKIHSPKYIISVLGKFLQEQDTNQVKDIRICSDGAVADMPTKIAKYLVDNQKSYNFRGISFEICKELPTLEEPKDFGGRDKSGRGRGGRGGSFGGGYGGKSGGQRNGSYGGNSRFGNRGDNSYTGRGGGFGGKSGNGGFQSNSWKGGNTWSSNNASTISF